MKGLKPTRTFRNFPSRAITPLIHSETGPTCRDQEPPRPGELFLATLFIPCSICGAEMEPPNPATSKPYQQFFFCVVCERIITHLIEHGKILKLIAPGRATYFVAMQ
jgi:hypothetical protein